MVIKKKYRKNKRSNKKKIQINKLNRKKCKINETKISAYTPVPLPFPAVSKDFSIPERSSRNKRIRRKIWRNMQFAES